MPATLLPTCPEPTEKIETPLVGALHDRLSKVLRHHPHLHHERLHCEAAEGRIVLRGLVRTFYQKQMAQEALRGVEGVSEIDNQLEVCWSGDVY